MYINRYRYLQIVLSTRKRINSMGMESGSFSLGNMLKEDFIMK